MPIRMSGLVSNMDTETIVKELMSAQTYQVTKVENKKTKLEWKQEKWKALNSKIFSFYTGALSKTKLQGNFSAKLAASSNTDKVEVKVDNSAPVGSQSIRVKSLASAQIVTGAKVEGDAISGKTNFTELGMGAAVGSKIEIKAGNETVNYEITSNSTIDEFVATLRNAGLNASFDTKYQRFFISASDSGYKNAFSIQTSSDAVDLSKLGLSKIAKSEPDANGVVSVTAANSNISLIKPSDASIILNGAELRSSSNTITVNGMTITVKGVTKGFDTEADTSDDEIITANVTKDTQAVYDLVKNFVKSYNELLKEMNDAYNADLAKGYEPLTDKQKEAMSEDQEKKWEDKIKNSLLRRDDVVGSVISAMRSSLSQNVTVDGKSYGLVSFGITSPDYAEKGLLHIDGDTEDTLVSMKEDQLRKAISDNPDAVMEVFTQLTSSLYKTMSDQMKSNELKSAYTVYNDKQMKKDIIAYDKQIKEMNKKLTVMETRYYKQFTAMETAMSKLNSQSSSLTSLLGQK